MRVVLIFWSACLFARLGTSTQNPEDLEGVGSEEALAGLDNAQEEPSGPQTEDQYEPDYASVLETLKKLRAKADESRKEDPSADADSGDVGGPDYGPPAVYSWSPDAAGDDAATGGQTGLSGDDDSDNSDESGFPDDFEFPEDILNDNGLHEWRGQIVGKIGIQGISGSKWNEDPTLTVALTQCVLNVTKIDASQLEFDKAKETEELGSSAGRRLLSFLRKDQFSLGYTINLRTDQKDEDAKAIVQALDDKVQTPDFVTSFKAKALELNNATVIDSMPNGALGFAVTARIVETPLVAPAPPDATEGEWGPVGLDDWGSHEYGEISMHNAVTTSIKLVIEGQHFEALASEQPLFKAATLLALKKDLRLDFAKHLEVQLKPGGQGAGPDWGGGSQLTENTIELTVDLRDVASSISETRVNGAMVQVVRDGTMVNQLCALAGGSWCLGAHIRVAELDTPPAPVDDLREPESKMLTGIPNVLAPYFN